jgi:CDP-paratose 2-epimerase
MKKILVTGSSGLIGSELCVHFSALGWEVNGVDNNQRAAFFDPWRDIISEIINNQRNQKVQQQ